MTVALIKSWATLNTFWVLEKYIISICRSQRLTNYNYLYIILCEKVLDEKCLGWKVSRMLHRKSNFAFSIKNSVQNIQIFHDKIKGTLCHNRQQRKREERLCVKDRSLSYAEQQEAAVLNVSFLHINQACEENVRWEKQADCGATRVSWAKFHTSISYHTLPTF